ncbi:unnamed protein product [Rhizoctonia solani]|uniref:Uncharacterized protein n=1 Tax=Rhizoctonia solani TaxID=456999 RepID=A0A8H2XAE2_9AGAM|nr:unnamed protein product [Rhizoctonia solani]
MDLPSATDPGTPNGCSQRPTFVVTPARFPRNPRLRSQRSVVHDKSRRAFLFFDIVMVVPGPRGVAFRLSRTCSQLLCLPYIVENKSV